MLRLVSVGLLVGLALLTGLVAYQGVGEIADAVALAGWGLLVVALFHLVPMAADARGWQTLLPPPERPRFRRILFARWLGESVNTLLPVLQLGGNVVKAHYLARRGMPGALAGASVVVDVTLVASSEVVFALLGIALLVGRLGDVDLTTAIAVGAALMSVALGGFYLAQRRGLFATLTGVLERVARGRDWSHLSAGAASLDAEIGAMYRARGRLGVAWVWHLVSWLVGAGEVWLALRFLGHPVDLGAALLLESLGQAIRAAAFVVPGALGIQESGYVVLGAALGLSPTVSLALSFAKRIRELALGLPGLVACQVAGTADLVRTGPTPRRDRRDG